MGDKNADGTSRGTFSKRPPPLLGLDCSSNVVYPRLFSVVKVLSVVVLTYKKDKRLKFFCEASSCENYVTGS